MSANEADGALDPDEPHTPVWFTLLGVGLFLLGGIFLLATSGDDEGAPEASVPEVSADAAPEPPGDEPRPQEGDARPDPHAGHGHD